MTVTTTVMPLTWVPFQHLGARAAAALTGHCDPEQLRPADLDAVVEIITADAVRASRSGKDEPGWAWYLALSAAYPNSPVTHHTYRRKPVAEQTEAVRALFTEHPGPYPVMPCWACGQETTHRWGKPLLPGAESPQHINRQPAGGQPVCRPCRIAVWAMPYAAICDGRTLTTLHAPGDGTAAQAVVQELVAYNRSAIDQEWSRWPERSRADTALRLVVDHPTDYEIYQWRNDNREPEGRLTILDGFTARWAARTRANAENWAGLRRLAERGDRPVLSLLTTERGSGWGPEMGLIALAADAAREGDPHDPASMNEAALLGNVALSYAEEQEAHNG
ncbi:hypothetical protein D5S17_35875 [Pseudonocardiaceae bacterium YIM PH 21723]|nr:hypothetical protein D5S17_35875 [Pseudonocardiaceae bacterium YIM PH 21723]